MTAAERLNEYYRLTKPKVVGLIVFTAIVGMLLSTPAVPPLDRFVFGTLGITLAAASAAVLNHILDRWADARMKRTRARPLPAGSIGVGESLIWAGVLGALGIAVLHGLVNPLAAWLTLAAMIGYALIYTVYLKRATPQNIVIGGAAGAAPPVLGWTAITGELHPDALLLFLIVFVWTPPHFWALAIHRQSDYAQVEIPMLPVTHGAAFTRLQILLYTVLLVAVSLLPFATRMSGWLYLAGALALGGVFLYYATALKYFPRAGLAMKTFGYSIVYLMGLFGVLLVDHYIPY